MPVLKKYLNHPKRYFFIVPLILLLITTAVGIYYFRFAQKTNPAKQKSPIFYEPLATGSSGTKNEQKIKPIEVKVDDLTFKCQQLIIVNHYTNSDNSISVVPGPENYCEIYKNNSLVIHTKYIYNVEYFSSEDLNEKNFVQWTTYFDYNKEAGLVSYRTDSDNANVGDFDYRLLDLKKRKETILQSRTESGRGGTWWDQGDTRISPKGSYVMIVNTVSEEWVGDKVTEANPLTIIDTVGKQIYSLKGSQAFWYSDNTFYYMELSAQYPVYRVDISTKTSTKILNSWARPVLSPDKTKIAFERDFSGEGGQQRSDVLIYNLDSKTETILVKDATGPKWIDSTILSVNTLRKCTPKDNCLGGELSYTILSEGAQYNLSGQLVKEGTVK